MRLRRLDLARYGKFTDRSIDFGQAIAGVPDLHIVYGPNEAGKSTAFSAFLDLLFGIEARSRYNFLHAYPAMRVGGCLELAGGARELVRIKSPAPTLRNAAHEPVAEATILGDLGGLDRAAYRTMFSLDDETLEAGGNAILASRGELGQLLFSASAGLSDLSRMLLDLKAAADGFAKAGGRSGALHDLKASLAALKQERDAIDTLASAYNRLATARDEAASQYGAALSERATVHADLAAIRRSLAALPRLEAHQHLLARIEAFAALPEAPPGWLEELPGLQRADTQHRSALDLAEAEVKRLTAERDAVALDEPARSLAGRLDRLGELRVRHIAAELDLPQRRRECAAVEGEIRAILARLDRADESDPARLLMTAAQTSVLASLIASRSGVAAELAAAGEEQSGALLALTEAARALHQDGQTPPPATLVPLKEALAALRKSDHVPRLRGALAARGKYGDTLAAELLALAPWQGSVEALAGLVVPAPASVQGWAASAQAVEALVAQRTEEVEKQEGALLRRCAELEAAGKIAGLLSDQDAADIRRVREAAWATHRRTLDADTAEAFEQALRQDDIVSQARLGHERELASLHEAAKAASIQRAEAQRAAGLLQDALAERLRHTAFLARAAAAIGLDPALSPAWLLAWLARRDKALESWAQHQQAGRDLAEAQAEATSLHSRLAEALSQAGLAFDRDSSPDALAAAAQEALDGEAQVQLLRQAATNAERDVRRRDAAVQKASLADRKWLGEWRQACAASWLGAAAADLPFETVREMLAASAGLARALASRADLMDRIQAMQDDQAAFARELDALAGELAMEAGRLPPVDLAQAIIDRVQHATRAAEEKRRIETACAAAGDTQRARAGEALLHARRAGEMMAFMQADSLIGLAGKLRDARERADLRRQVAAAEAEILAALRVQDLAEAQLRLAAQDAVELERGEAKLAAQLEALEHRTRTLFAASKQAADQIAAVGGDGAAARIEERRRTKLLEIEEGASHYLRLRLGIAAADRALRAYRDQHRSAMMYQASEAFAIISRGAYRGLGTQPDRDGAGDLLVAIGADGGFKLAPDLSKGTRFQLYLALRAAGYREFAKLRPPVPFIADDIMETFDDMRAEETLRVLGDMAGLGQVIYLTHHDHLRAIAERTCPGVRIHHLRPRRSRHV